MSYNRVIEGFYVYSKKNQEEFDVFKTVAALHGVVVTPRALVVSITNPEKGAAIKEMFDAIMANKRV